ncbi:YhdH/YhfP family quinone oxidoreductase [Vagococcus carniphilus]|uniref:YhdH/YhfP family quinone oxidoreductase n=1 Tax=Vagococcus carniphilus TaxID=218144 RepID=A0AAW8UA76_9ENTE|nr:YhdH/YhfP family quinone oxidoreductase [Vagococcus carniphilus]MDT2831742.1 YhdH/YhfP family quinone oxidoreductase [Vagococcus carniphilus]MDT2835099.1 YhdH/YhfP family quinone oxidoreductase [Vagococcus carniphilus]MDT2840595.1 YhdH/YhfP family quinone oxidoreductase [Vagococcus carniphilus]MDT2855253.1 YhdH/YhfP family quinone oxidoreductase [Vagococcus carniphilus]
MMNKTFKALVVEEKEDDIVAKLKECEPTDLGEGGTIIKAVYTGVNYKDALATIKNGGVIRSYPMIPGIDVVGEIIETTDLILKKGDRVVVTGNGLGVTHTGGFSEVVRVPNEWVVKLPETVNDKKAATIGTAGITALQAISQLEKIGLSDKNARILVTGATGGVGSIAIAMLKSLGYDNITALSRKKNEAYLQQLGSKDIIGLEEFMPERIKPLQKQNFDYVIDTIGGESVAAILPQINYGGGIALCGNASGIKFSTTVLPFILRGITMVGIDSVQLSNDVKTAIWNRIGNELDEALLAKIGNKEESLENIESVVTTLLEGSHSGRTLIKI